MHSPGFPLRQPPALNRSLLFGSLVVISIFISFIFISTELPAIFSLICPTIPLPFLVNGSICNSGSSSTSFLNYPTLSIRPRQSSPPETSSL